MPMEPEFFHCPLHEFLRCDTRPQPPSSSSPPLPLTSHTQSIVPIFDGKTSSSRIVGSLLLTVRQPRSTTTTTTTTTVIELKFITSVIPQTWPVDGAVRHDAKLYWRRVATTPFPRSLELVEEEEAEAQVGAEVGEEEEEGDKAFMLPVCPTLTRYELTKSETEAARQEFNIIFGANLCPRSHPSSSSTTQQNGTKLRLQLLNSLRSGAPTLPLLSALHVDSGECLSRIMQAATVTEETNGRRRQVRFSNVDCVYPIGTDCAAVQSVRFAGLRRCAYPLDWVRTHPKGVLQLLHDVTDNNNNNNNNTAVQLVPVQHKLDTGLYTIDNNTDNLSTGSSTREPTSGKATAAADAPSLLLCDPKYLFVGPADQMRLYAERMHRLCDGIIGRNNEEDEEEDTDEEEVAACRRVILLHIGHVEHGADELRIRKRANTIEGAESDDEDDVEPCDTTPLLNLLKLRKFALSLLRDKKKEKSNATSASSLHIIAFNVEGCPDFEWPGITHLQLGFQGFATGRSVSEMTAPSSDVGSQEAAAGTAQRVAALLKEMVSLR